MDEKEFNKLFYFLSKMKGQKLDEEACKMWYLELKKYQDAAVQKAFRIYWRDPETRLILGKMIGIVKSEIREPLGLPSPVITDEQRQHNLKKFAEIKTMLAKSMQMPKEAIK